jgi:SAM-dependent methyltransferase
VSGFGSETRKIEPKEMKTEFTRGRGLFEPLLARLRAHKANQLIPPEARKGRILDIGCGSYPYFLSHTFFQEKFAIDQLRGTFTPADITFYEYDLNKIVHLPFDDLYFNVVTMLAVIEHLNPDTLVELFREIYRVLRPGGILILTTPAAWTDRLLRFMAKIKLVSAEEINEHVFVYTLPLLGWYFGVAGFRLDRLEFGYFEAGVNLWATARR